MDLFTSAHQNYDYNQLCDEIESIHRDEDESIDDFYSRIVQNYYIFHDDDQASKEYFDKTTLSLIRITLQNLKSECSSMN
jgi:superfamily I DNA and RNA helicase